MKIVAVVRGRKAVRSGVANAVVQDLAAVSEAAHGPVAVNAAAHGPVAAVSAARRAVPSCGRLTGTATGLSTSSKSTWRSWFCGGWTAMKMAR